MESSTKTHRCPECNFWTSHNHETEGLCYSCERGQKTTLCPDCGVYGLREGQSCYCAKEGIEKVQAEHKDKMDWFKNEFPLATSCEVSSEFFTYYENAYERTGPVDEWWQHLINLVKEHNIPHETEEELVAAYHAMYGY